MFAARNSTQNLEPLHLGICVESWQSVEYAALNPALGDPW